MTDDDVLFGFRLQLFAHAARTSVSEACRLFGVHRSTYYRWKQQVDRHGLELLRPRERRAARLREARHDRRDLLVGGDRLVDREDVLGMRGAIRREERAQVRVRLSARHGHFTPA